MKKLNLLTFALLFATQLVSTAPAQMIENDDEDESDELVPTSAQDIAELNAAQDIGLKGCSVKFLKGPRSQIRPSGEVEQYSLNHNNEQRSYLLKRGKAPLTPGEKIPLVIEFHGAFQSAAIETYCYGLDKVVTAAKGIIVYPQAAWFAWNTSAVLKENQDSRRNKRRLGKIIKVKHDDVGFTNRLIDELLEQNPQIDPKRIYVVGYSSGGFMAYRAAAELSDRIAAAAVVSGGLNMNMSEIQRPQPVPMFQVHGALDPLVTYKKANGGIAAVRSTLATLEIWKDVNRCEKTPVVDEILKHPDTGYEYRRWIWAPKNADEGAVVEFLLFPKYTHMFPSNVRPSVTPQIWEFFMKNKRK